MGNSWFPDGCGISIDTQDGHLDLADVTWQAVAPCGCVSGLTVAAVKDDLTITPEQAMRAFASSEAEYKRDVELGFTCRPREHHAACDEAKRGCEHNPKWGYEKPPVPAGYVWAAVRALGSRPKYTHLVPVESVEAAKARDYSRLDVPPLCGGKPAFHWNDEWYAKDGKVECKRCIAAGHKIAQAAS